MSAKNNEFMFRTAQKSIPALKSEFGMFRPKGDDQFIFTLLVVQREEKVTVYALRYGANDTRKYRIGTYELHQGQVINRKPSRAENADELEVIKSYFKTAVSWYSQKGAGYDCFQQKQYDQKRIQLQWGSVTELESTFDLPELA